MKAQLWLASDGMTVHLTQPPPAPRRAELPTLCCLQDWACEPRPHVVRLEAIAGWVINGLLILFLLGVVYGLLELALRQVERLP